MIHGEATQQLKAALPAEHYEAANRSLLVGGGLFMVGLVLVVMGMVLLFKTTFDKWLLAPIALGFLSSVLGAHVASSKRVGAAIKDVGSALLPFKRGGS